MGKARRDKVPGVPGKGKKKGRPLRWPFFICVLLAFRYSIPATMLTGTQIAGMTVALIVLAIILVVTLFFGVRQISHQSPPSSLTPTKRAELQTDKDKACGTVERLRKAGAFTKIVPGHSGVTHAYVDRDFYAIPINAKETALKAVALCHVSLDEQQQIGLVVIHDGYSGKRIGTFDFTSGLDLD